MLNEQLNVLACVQSDFFPLDVTVTFQLQRPGLLHASMAMELMASAV